MKLACTLIVATACLGLTWYAVAAQEKPSLTREETRMMDADKDGAISQQEYAKLRADMAAWSAMDTDGDGRLDAEEQRRALRPAPIVRTH